MILLDTNVISALMLPEPSAVVVDWLNGQDTTSLYLSTITVAEIGFGLAVLPKGKRRRNLEAQFERFIADGFAGRLWDFDEDAARLYGGIMAQRRASGRPMSVADGQIAAIARSKGARLATRNLRDFEACGLDLIDPFRGT